MIEQSFTRIMQVMVHADLWSNTYDFRYSLFEIFKGRLEKKQQSTKKAVFRIKKQGSGETATNNGQHTAT